jgi:hypothetical protein
MSLNKKDRQYEKQGGWRVAESAEANPKSIHAFE